MVAGVNGRTLHQSQSHLTTDSQSVSQYVLVSTPLCERLTRYCFLFKSLCLEFVVLSLWGALSDERPGLSFVSHSLVNCLCVHLLFTFLSFIYLPYIYTLYNTYNIYKASFSPGFWNSVVASGYSADKLFIFTENFGTVISEYYIC
jgi:hypothetical protein